MKVLKEVPDGILKYKSDKRKSWLMFTKIDDTDLEIDEVTSRKAYREFRHPPIPAKATLHFAAHALSQWHASNTLA